MGPVSEPEIGEARAARLELVAADGRVPEGVGVHLKLDTGMGRWGLAELPAPGRDVVGVMSHLASAESDEEFTRAQIERFRDATAGLTGLTRHLANSAGTLRYPDAAFDAVRCGIALYGISPFGRRSGGRRARAGAPLGVVPRAREAARAGREHRLRAPLRRGRADVDRVVPVGYADGFRRDLTGTEVLVGGERCRGRRDGLYGCARGRASGASSRWRRP